VIDAALKCVDCGAEWQSAPAAQIAVTRGCLTCGGRLVRVESGDAERSSDSAPPADGDD
jgi:predicted  nucleic acid-binding Zn-ribbon protein